MDKKEKARPSATRKMGAMKAGATRKRVSGDVVYVSRISFAEEKDKKNGG